MMRGRPNFYLVMGIAIFLVQCSFFQQPPEDLPLVKPIPVGGYGVLGSRIHYPEHVRELGIEGTVVVRAHIDKNGSVLDVVILEGIHEELDRISANAVKKTLFTPAMRGQEAVDVWISLPIVFALKDWPQELIQFDAFAVTVSPDDAYQVYGIETSVDLSGADRLPYRMEALLPLNYEKLWARDESGKSIPTRVIQDDQGDWVSFEAATRHFSYGFQTRPIFKSSDPVFRYALSVNHAIPDWKLCIRSRSARVRFNQDPEQITSENGMTCFEYNIESQDMYVTRYLEIGLER